MPRYLSYRRPIQEINGKLYIIHAEYDERIVKNSNLIKEWLGVDYVFRVRAQGTMIFCELIKDIEWEDIT
jgi:hypothetical protein